MKHELLAISCALLLFTSTVPVEAQEVQVPLDEEGKLLTIDRRLERELELFPEYDSFREARLFRVSDTSFVLEISYTAEDELLKDRRQLSAAETEDFRHQITSRVRTLRPRALLDQSGRARFIVGTAAVSLGYYGWAVPYAMDITEPASYMSAFALSSSCGFFVPLWATHKMRITDAAGTMGFYGASRGIAHGMFLEMLLRGNSTEPRSRVGVSILTSLTEGVAGLYVGNRWGISGGTAEAIGVGGDFGLYWGVCAAAAGDYDDRAVGTSILAGSAIGLLTGRLLANQQSYTRGDAYVVRAAGMLGGYLPMAVVDSDDEDTFWTSSMLGSAIGVGVGHLLTRNKDFTTGEGALLNFGEVMGGLLMVGIVYRINPDDDDDEKRFLTASALGAGGAFVFLYLTTADDAGDRARRSSFDFQIAPEGLAALAISDEETNRQISPILLRLAYTF